MRRRHKKNRKHSMTFYGTRETRKTSDCLCPKHGPPPGQRSLRTLKSLAHVAAIIGTIMAIADALHRW
jgi:hypothetical protein